jgi:hypothetical protein
LFTSQDQGQRRRRDLQRLTSGGLPDLADEHVMRAAWQR